MAWIKRNLFLVVAAVVALALLGIAGFFLWTRMQADQEVQAQLDQAIQRYEELGRRPVHPGTEDGKVNNIELAKDEHKRLESFLGDVRAKFGQREIPTNQTDRDFRAFLDQTISELQKQASRQGVGLPETNYWFSFAAQKAAFSFKSREMLTHQLMDVRELCELLFAAKINDLKSIRRVPASSDDNNSQDFMTDKKPVTNDFAIVTPYEITFQGFSSELARVLDRLVNARRVYVVKSVAVDQLQSEDSNTGGAGSEMMMMQQQMMMRFMRGGRGMPMMPPPTAPVAPAATRRPPNVLLDENKLRMVILLDAVRLKDPAPKAAGRSGARPAPETAAVAQP